ncbi:uncharacterized protein L969DRAFT_15559 [Mixia osmundae IAM 14324]|uniref:Uncharacterized protein n=1 Tax=Mixia osmundae (strain CBS 9802 / IAM 14324 / JCM 22182 / KY 12970) TaxID=764103 RepID=G7DYH5_MIXOS|nr:uncharacterized protein L969DRAFT_15559 [Mixia osmundae IAM 14324]KEI41536.1 hypothetical protein L969DRAFT_15559 [Mixia osmundae IAM 14324]GAA95635.1 hypothetical protein E5Q_02291 [Mixia osmundae IAM 14324]
MSSLVALVDELLGSSRQRWQVLDGRPFASAALLAGSAAALFIVYNIAHQLLVPRKRSLPPLVFHWVPFIGSAVSYGIDPYAFLLACREKYGPVFTFVLLGRKVTVALGPSGSNFVLNGRLHHVSAEEAYTHLTTPVFGKGVVYDCPNHMLMEQKKFIKVGLSTENFKLYVGMVVDEVIAYLDQHVPKTNTAMRDAFTTSSEITICTASRTLQGKEVRRGMDASFAELYHDLDGGFTPIAFAFPSLPLPNFRRRDRAQVKMRNFYLDIMKKRRESGDESASDMLQALQGCSYKDGRTLSDQDIAHMMIALLMAGQHTSAATGAWLLLHLGERPDLQDALLAEQKKAFGNKSGSLDPLDYERLQTPLLHACVKEVLRLHPPLHSLMRKVIADMPVPTSLSAHSEEQPYIVPKGYYVLAAPGVTQVDPVLWPDPTSFDPYRWLEGTKSSDATKSEKDSEQNETIDYGFGAIATGATSPYIPFGAGRHRCIGEQYAHLQLGAIFATLVRQTTWKLNGSLPKQDYTTMIVMPQKPRDVIFTRR